MTKMTLTQIKNSLANAHIWEPNIRAALASTMRDCGAQGIVQTLSGTTRGEVSSRAKGRFVGTFPQLLADAATVRATVDGADIQAVGARKYAAMVEAAAWLEERVDSYINAYARNNRVEIVAEEPAPAAVTTEPETMTTTHITPEHKTLVVALHAGVTHSKLFDENAKTHALVHPAAGSVSWRSSACTRKSVLDRGFVSVKCRVYALKPRYTVTVSINGTRYAAHVDRLGGHFMQLASKNAQDCVVTSVHWFASKNASKCWQERGCAMLAPEQIEDRGVTVRVQADAVLARLAPVTEAPAAPAPVTTEPETTEPAAPAPLAPVELGTSPAGVEWVVYPKSTETESEFHARVQVGRERLAALNAKQAPASLAPVTPVTTTPETETMTNDTPILRAAALLAYVAAHHADDTVDNDLVKRALKRGDADAADQFLHTVSVDLSYTAPRATMLAQLALHALHDNEPTVYGVLVDAMDDACLPAYEDAEYTLRYDALEEQGHPLPADHTWDDVRASVDAAYEEAQFLLREAELREAAREAVRAAEAATTRAREVLEALCAEAGADA